MITKRQFCEYIINEYKNGDGLEKISEVNDSHITRCSRLAVAMEHLGLIKDQAMKEYAKTRGGVLFHFVMKTDKGLEQATLTVRELLKLLPD